MSIIRSVHDGLSMLVVVTGFFAGSWAVAAHFKEQYRSERLWVAHNVFHVLIAIQVMLGGLLVGFSDVEADPNHMFYGFLTFVGIGIIIGYRHLSQYKYLLYGAGGLFVMGLAIRAMLLNPLVTVP